MRATNHHILLRAYVIKIPPSLGGIFYGIIFLHKEAPGGATSLGCVIATHERASWWGLIVLGAELDAVVGGFGDFVHACAGSDEPLTGDCFEHLGHEFPVIV